MYCSKCGKQIKDESKYCPYCGNKLTKGLSTSSLTAEGKKDVKKIWIIAIVIVLLIAVSNIVSDSNDINININVKTETPSQDEKSIFSTNKNKYAGVYGNEDRTIVLAKDYTYILIDKSDEMFKLFEAAMGTYTADKDIITLYLDDTVFTYYNYADNELIGADTYEANTVYKNIGKASDTALSEKPNVKKLKGNNYVGTRETYSFINDSEVLMNGTKVNYRNTENVLFINEVSYNFDFVGEDLVLFPVNGNVGKYFRKVDKLDEPNDEFSNDEGRGDTIPTDDALSPDEIPDIPQGVQSFEIEYSN